jgi:mRNA-degrading endonuclease RelE of RelBE toxin-antitoxin system
MKKRIWSEDEIKIVKQMYADNPSILIAEKLNRSISQVYNCANRLGLKKSEEYRRLELQRQGEKLKKAGTAFRFNKGQEAFNKGKKMSDDLYKKIKHTFFQKGLEPHNTKYNGHTRITKDGYQEIRIKKGKYRLLHIVNWENINGPLPKGYCLSCIDGDRTNTDASNWQLISRADNMKLNTIHRYPKEVKELIKLTSKIKRKIQNYEKQD